MSSPYDILGVGKDASDDEVKKAYHQKAIECSNDGGDLIELNGAYNAIKSKRRKSVSSQESVVIADNDPLRECKKEYCGLIDSFNYIDRSVCTAEIAGAKSMEAILNIYTDAGRSNTFRFANITKGKILQLKFISEEEKESYFKNIDNIKGFGKDAVAAIEGIYLVAAKADSIEIMMNFLEYLDISDKNEYIDQINKATNAKRVSEIFRMAAFINYKRKYIDYIERLEYLSEEEKLGYFQQMAVFETPEQFEKILADARKHNEIKKGENLSSRFHNFLSSVVGTRPRRKR